MLGRRSQSSGPPSAVRFRSVPLGSCRASIIREVSRKHARRPDSAFGTLTSEQQRAWLAYMRVQLRLTYEMNRELQADSDLSLPDYDVLNALRYAPGGRMRITALAARIGWERSRLSHHARRLQNRGLVECRPAPADRRATEMTLTDPGWDEITRRFERAHRAGATAVLRRPAGRATRAAHARARERLREHHRARNAPGTR